MNKPNHTIDLVIFDIAGTSVRDDGFVERAFLSVSQHHRLGLDAAWIKPRMGVHKLAVMREALEHASNPGDTSNITPEQLAAEFEQAIDHEVQSGNAPAMPGFIELFDDLRGSGVKVAFTTGFARTTAETVLKGAGIAYDMLVASDEVARGRPDPDIVLEAMRRAGVDDPSRIAVIGDTPNDLGSATNANAALAIGVGHGTHRIVELADHPHTHLASNMNALRDLLAQHTPIPSHEHAHG